MQISTGSLQHCRDVASMYMPVYASLSLILSIIIAKTPDITAPHLLHYIPPYCFRKNGFSDKWQGWKKIVCKVLAGCCCITGEWGGFYVCSRSFQALKSSVIYLLLRLFLSKCILVTHVQFIFVNNVICLCCLTIFGYLPMHILVCICTKEVGKIRFLQITYLCSN